MSRDAVTGEIVSRIYNTLGNKTNCKAANNIEFI